MTLEIFARALLALALLYLAWRAIRALRRRDWPDRLERLRLPQISDDALILAIIYGAIVAAGAGLIYFFVRAP